MDIARAITTLKCSETYPEMLERHPDANVVAGSAIAAEAAMGEGRNLTTPLTIVSFYLTHQVYRGLKRGHILMALSDQMARREN